MERWKRELAILWFSVLLSSASYTMIVPFLPLYLLELGVSEQAAPLWSGVIFSVTFLVGAILAPYWGARSDRHGQRKMVIRAGVSLAAVYFLGAWVRNPYELFAMRVLQGVASGFLPAALTMVASTVPRERMGWALGIMHTASSSGSILGPLLGGVWSHYYSMRMSFVAAAVVVFAATMGVRYFVQEREIAESQKRGDILADMRAAAANRILLVMLGILLAVQMTVMIRQPLISLYVKDLTGSLEGAALYSGIVFSLPGVAGILAAPLWGELGQRRGFLLLLLIALLGTGLTNLLHLAIGSLWEFGVLQFLFGLFLAGAYPLINAIAMKYTDETFRGRMFGLTTTANQLGQMAGPLIGGVANSWLGIPVIFAWSGGILIAAALVVGCLWKRK